ncbi:MAG: MATE family efflux transporter [Eubacteriales bacterium]|nr:MATE family efflux transporter [Eubacteriales bacterium]
MKKVRDLTEGSIVGGFVMFALPLFGGSLFQQLYSTVDMLFVGNILGKNAAAAIGASGILVTCLINLFTGIAVGAGIVIAQLFGAKKEEELKDAVWVSILAGAVGGIFLMCTGFYLARYVLALLNTPEVLMEDALLYVRIYFLATVSMILYNMCAGILRAQGDSRTPFFVLAVGGILNVFMDGIFLIQLEKGVEGVAFATLISQTFTAAALLIHIFRRSSHLLRRNIRWDLLRRIVRLGLPVGIQSMILTLSNVIVQYHINGFGEDAMAAFAVYFKAEHLLCLPIMAFGQAMVTFTGQNFGAHRLERIRKGIISCNGIAAAVIVVIAGVSLRFGPWLLGAFCPDEAVVENGMRIISVTFPLYFLYSFFEVTGGVIRGIGKSLSSMVIVITNLCLVRILLLEIFDRLFHSIESIAAVYPITWFLALASFAGYYVYVCRGGRELAES